MRRLRRQPVEFQEEVFERLFSSLDIKKFTKMDAQNYISRRIAELDEIDRYKSAVRAGIEQGRKEGRSERLEEGEEKGTLKVARGMKAEGMDISLIIKLTGLTSEQVSRL